MAVKQIPAGCYRQSDESEEVSSAGSSAFLYILKGPYSVLETFMHSLSKGDTFEGAPDWVADSWRLQRRPGDLGLLTVGCNPLDTVTADEETDQIALDETWTLRTVRNDCSILAYCGPSPANPQRAIVEAWQKEPDGELADQLQYTKPDGTVYTIDGGSATADLIEKLRKGIDTVMRFYPLLTKTRTYSSMPATVFVDMCTIDTPTLGVLVSAEATDAKGRRTRRLSGPGNLGEIIVAYSWLKCQDDVTLAPDGKYQRIESWMGTPKTPGWDVNLYGTAAQGRWSMPYQKQ